MMMPDGFWQKALYGWSFWSVLAPKEPVDIAYNLFQCYLHGTVDDTSSRVVSCTA